jgi:hypothetical protein
MAPAAKRKKPFVDDQSSLPAPKPRAKRQKKTTDPTDSIETPPPTPKPAAATKGQKSNAVKPPKLNGDQPKANGVVGAETDETLTADNASIADSPVEDAVVKAAAPARKRRIVEDEEDEESVTNGQENGITPAAPTDDKPTTTGSEQQAILTSQSVADKTAKASTPVTQPSATEALEVPDQAPITTSITSPTIKSEEPPTIHPTTEQAASMEQAKKKDKPKPKDREKRDKLYQYCIRRKPVGEIFSIGELTAANVADDEQDLLNLCQQLVTHFLFAAMTLNRGVLYKTRSYEVAKK